MSDGVWIANYRMVSRPQSNAGYFLENVRKSTDKSIVCSTAYSENSKENFEAPP